MRAFFLFMFICTLGGVMHAQQQDAGFVSGKVLNAANDVPISNVSVINLSKVNGTITDNNGEFKIRAEVNDTLYFTYLGFESMRIPVTDDWKKYGHVKIKMTEVGIALHAVTISPVKLTGYLEIDAKNIPIYESNRYQITGGLGYEAGYQQPSGFSRTLSSIFNPIDFLHNLFGNKPRQMRKLEKMKEDDAIQRLLEQKFDRETIAVLLGVSKNEINKILRHCNYSKNFIKTANDLQILEAISDCYENYRVLHQG